MQRAYKMKQPESITDPGFTTHTKLDGRSSLRVALSDYATNLLIGVEAS